MPAYPEGHPDIADDVLLATLLEKQRYASYMATQMCFNPDAITSWIRRLRAQGVSLPDPPRRAGRGRDHEADAGRGADRRGRLRSLPEEEPQDRRPPALAGELRPDALLEGLGATVADPAAAIQRLHVFTFNEVGATVAWQQRMLAELGEVA